MSNAEHCNIVFRFGWFSFSFENFDQKNYIHKYLMPDSGNALCCKVTAQLHNEYLYLYGTKINNVSLNLNLQKASCCYLLFTFCMEHDEQSNSVLHCSFNL